MNILAVLPQYAKDTAKIVLIIIATLIQPAIQHWQKYQGKQCRGYDSTNHNGG